MKEPYIDRNYDLLYNARQNRREMTPQERHLWYDFLAKHPVKWCRQDIIYQYIVDLYCRRARLVIEVDGSQHYTPEGLENDRIRTENLENYGIKVIRFKNTEIDRHFAAVCAEIDRVLAERLSAK